MTHYVTKNRFRLYSLPVHDGLTAPLFPWTHSTKLPFWLLGIFSKTRTRTSHRTQPPLGLRAWSDVFLQEGIIKRPLPCTGRWVIFLFTNQAYYYAKVWHSKTVVRPFKSDRRTGVQGSNAKCLENQFVGNLSFVLPFFTKSTRPVQSRCDATHCFLRWAVYRCIGR